MNKRFEIFYFLKNAPLAIIASALPGFINYAVILFLASFFAMEDVGEFRLIISYFMLLGLFSLKESTKIMVRTQALDDNETSAALFFARFYTILLTAIAIAIAWAGQKVTGHDIVPDSLMLVAVISIFAYPTELFLSYLQAEKRFTDLAVISIAKYMAALAVCIAVMMATKDITVSAMSMVAVMSAFNVLFYVIFLGNDLLAHAGAVWKPFGLAKRQSTHESFTLSLANWLPGTLEHVDKIIIGAVFGLEILGLYTLCFSTGRFIYNALKPAFYIYYRHFVDKLPSRKLLWLVMASFTVFGALLSLIFYAGTLYIPFFEKFSGGEAVVYILFLSYGIAMADAVYTQSYGINKESKSHHLLIANTGISLFCLLMFAGCTLTGAGIALMICALHYPVRHFGTIVFLSLLSGRSAARSL